MKKTHLLPFLFVSLLAACQVHSLRLDEDEVKATSLHALLAEQGLEKGQVRTNIRFPKGKLLVHAAQEGWLPVVHKLLLDGAPMDSKDKYGLTPLHRAAEEGHTEVVRLLLDKGAWVDSKNNLGYTPLHKAAQGGHTEIAALLIEKGAVLDSTNRLGRTPLHLAAYSGHTAVAQLLSYEGADLSITNNDGETALEVAQKMGKKGVSSLIQVKIKSQPPPAINWHISRFARCLSRPFSR